MATTNDVNNWYGRNKPSRTVFNPRFRVKRGIVKILYSEWAAQFAGKVMVEPHIKATFSGENKRWPWDRWQELVDRSSVPLIQCAPPGTKFLDGVQQVETPSFDHAISVLSVSRALVTTEGGLHHAAGALNKPAVVIYGAFNSPNLFGYEGHINLSEPDPECLGMRTTHPACIAAMERITVDRVLEAMRSLCL